MRTSIPRSGDSRHSAGSWFGPPDFANRSLGHSPSAHRARLLIRSIRRGAPFEYAASGSCKFGLLPHKHSDSIATDVSYLRGTRELLDGFMTRKLSCRRRRTSSTARVRSNPHENCGHSSPTDACAAVANLPAIGLRRQARAPERLHPGHNAHANVPRGLARTVGLATPSRRQCRGPGSRIRLRRSRPCSACPSGRRSSRGDGISVGHPK
jgi:hypothetical protein